MRRRMTVTTNHRQAWQRNALFRPDHMRNALPLVAPRKHGHAELLAVAFDCGCNFVGARIGQIIKGCRYALACNDPASQTTDPAAALPGHVFRNR